MTAVEADPATEIEIDVAAAHGIRALDSASTEHFELDDFAQYRLMNGLDDIGLTLQKQPTRSPTTRRSRSSFNPVATGN